jgi:hypothetical protein
MPKLDFPELTKADAIFHLMVLYRTYPQFNKELDTTRKPYLQGISKFMQDIRASIQKNKMPLLDYCRDMIEFFEGRAETSLLTEEQQKTFIELGPYLYALKQLAVKWKLKAPWATRALFFSDFAILLSLLPFANLIPHEESFGSFEMFNKIIPFHSPIAPFKIELSALVFSAYSRDEIISEISDRLREYEKKIKAAGITEYPSRLRRHAEWWFEHYVNGMKYDDIAQQEIHTPGGSIISYAKSVGNAVRGFGKLIEIHPHSKSIKR